LSFCGPERGRIREEVAGEGRAPKKVEERGRDRSIGITAKCLWIADRSEPGG